MTSQDDNSDREPYFLFTSEEADRLVTEAMDTSPDEPEPFVKLLHILFDNTEEPRLKEAIYELMKAAYNGSIVHSLDFDDYLEAIKKGQNPLEKARARGRNGQESEAKQTSPERNEK